MPLTSRPEVVTVSPDQRTRRTHLRELIEQASHFLPAQGPISVFVHHNTLHAFEDLPFDQAVQKGAQIFGCQPYRSEEWFRGELRQGRLRFSELQEVLEVDLGETAKVKVPGVGTRLDLRLSMLQYPILNGPTEELVWHVAEADALRKIRHEVSSALASRMVAETRRWVVRDLRKSSDSRRNVGAPETRQVVMENQDILTLLDRFGVASMESWTTSRWESFTLQALWKVCCEGVRELPPFIPSPTPAVRHRDLLFEVTGADSDTRVNERMIRIVAAFLDQGLAQRVLPRRQDGLYRSFCLLYKQRFGPPDRWLQGLSREVTRLEEQAITPIDSILESLEILGVAESEWEGFIASTLLSLRGWAGMIRQVEIRSDRVVHPIPQGSLVEYFAIQLILERFALASTAKDTVGFDGPLSKLRDLLRSQLVSGWPPSIEQRAFTVFQIVQLFGLTPDVLHRLTSAEWSSLVQEVETFTEIERRRIFHQAYEKRFTTRTLDAISLRARHHVGRPIHPHFQTICCIDEREESFRRHLEEVVPKVETFGVAGFFNVPMYYRGVADAHYVPLCPVVIRPQNWIDEELVNSRSRFDRVKSWVRRMVGMATHQFHLSSRSFAAGALLTGAVGALASVPLVGRILFPRSAGRIRRMLGRFVRISPRTRLRLEHRQEGRQSENGPFGFSLDEMVGMGERMLRDIGLTDGFARIVVLIGHGSSSQNNPHLSAYHCGACGGSGGGPNARAIAQILSDSQVRERLGARGLTIPIETIFVGGSHNTCDDSVVFYDLERVPESHRLELEVAIQRIDEACERNAHERCRRFLSAPLTLSYQAAREHVEERSEDLAQTRPELGHATNAITIIGRRDWTRGLFLDRRSFLTSYDPTTDDADNTILTRVLQAVIPVSSGINLEYYFSNVDNAGFGCGTKLPHNIASLLGVMDGASSDLRTGLPWQMVEIHEPVRSLFIVETTPESMLRIIDQNEGIGRICRNGWIQLAVLHPSLREISQFHEGQFHRYEPRSTETPRASSSVDWYGGWRDHLEFAEIEESSR